VETPRLTSEQIPQVSGLVAQYIATQRERYASRAVPLSAQQRAAMGGFFSPQLLDGTRLLVLQGERVANPDFYPMLRSLGFNNLPDQSAMAAITFCGCCGLARTVLEWTVVSRTRPRGTVSATWHSAILGALRAWISEWWQLRGDTLGSECIHAGRSV